VDRPEGSDMTPLRALQKSPLPGGVTARPAQVWTSRPDRTGHPRCGSMTRAAVAKPSRGVCRWLADVTSRMWGADELSSKGRLRMPLPTSSEEG
jgi:hypothetical protein